MKDVPLISVIVPVYNVAAYLPRCVQSLLVQSFEDFEVILVDDGSTDVGGLMCDAFAELDGRVRVVHQANAGISAARNAGIAAARGDWFAFVDSDDAVHPQYLKALLDAAMQASAQVATVDFVRVRGCGDEEVAWPANIAGAPRVLTGREVAKLVSGDGDTGMITVWGKLYAASLKPQLMHPVGKIHEDEFVTYRALYVAEVVVCLSAKLYGYTERIGGLSNTWNIKRLDRLEALQGAIEFYEQEGDAELAMHARKRYMVNIPISYYFAHEGMRPAEAQTILQQLKLRFDNYYTAHYQQLKHLMSPRERAMVATFASSPAAFCAVSKLLLKK